METTDIAEKLATMGCNMELKPLRRRLGSWAMALTIEQQWDVYAMTLRIGNWEVVTRLAKQKYKHMRMPSKAAFYRWKRSMQANSFARKIESIVSSNAMANVLAGDKGTIRPQKSNKRKAAGKDGRQDCRSDG